jgi:hypothetical protein
MGSLTGFAKAVHPFSARPSRAGVLRHPENNWCHLPQGILPLLLTESDKET